MNEVSKVIVLLSTYNGEKYLREQLDSILSQEEVSIEFVIRDDGSTDGTQRILEDYKIPYIKGTNIGYLNSYIYLVTHAPVAEYYAFADQDDIWLPTKLKVAVDCLKRADKSKPVLYSCGRYEMIDGSVKVSSSNTRYRNTGFSGFLNGYSLQACSMVFNYKLKNLIENFKPTGLTCAHDTWLLQVCKVSDGEIIVDRNPYFIYRIGSNNTLGLPKHRILLKLKQLISKEKRPFSDVICSNLLFGYGDMMTKDKKEVCILISNYRRNKVRVLMNRSIYRGTFMQNILLFLQICAGIA